MRILQYSSLGNGAQMVRSWGREFCDSCEGLASVMGDWQGAEKQHWLQKEHTGQLLIQKSLLSKWDRNLLGNPPCV